jgi:hypothetical protein
MPQKSSSATNFITTHHSIKSMMMKVLLVSSFCMLLSPKYVSATTIGAEDECYPFAVALDFYNAEVTVNNLGGKGPNYSDVNK